MAASGIPERFLVAFSLAGEQRELVRAIALAVADEIGREHVFLDEWFEHYVAGDDADLKLQRIYGEGCALAVVCVSARYRRQAVDAGRARRDPRPADAGARRARGKRAARHPADPRRRGRGRRHPLQRHRSRHSRPHAAAGRRLHPRPAAPRRPRPAARRGHPRHRAGLAGSAAAAAMERRRPRRRARRLCHAADTRRAVALRVDLRPQRIGQEPHRAPDDRQRAAPAGARLRAPRLQGHDRHGRRRAQLRAVPRRARAAGEPAAGRAPWLHPRRAQEARPAGAAAARHLRGCRRRGAGVGRAAAARRRRARAVAARRRRRAEGAAPRRRGVGGERGRAAGRYHRRSLPTGTPTDGSTGPGSRWSRSRSPARSPPAASACCRSCSFGAQG